MESVKPRLIFFGLGVAGEPVEPGLILSDEGVGVKPVEPGLILSGEGVGVEAVDSGGGGVLELVHQVHLHKLLLHQHVLVVHNVGQQPYRFLN